MPFVVPNACVVKHIFFYCVSVIREHGHRRISLAGKRAQKLLLLAIVTLRTGGSQRPNISIGDVTRITFLQDIKINSQFGVSCER